MDLLGRYYLNSNSDAQPIESFSAFLSGDTQLRDVIRFGLSLLCLFSVRPDRRAALHELRSDVAGDRPALHQFLTEPEYSNGKLEGSFANNRCGHASRQS